MGGVYLHQVRPEIVQRLLSRPAWGELQKAACHGLGVALPGPLAIEIEERLCHKEPKAPSFRVDLPIFREPDVNPFRENMIEVGRAVVALQRVSKPLDSTNQLLNHQPVVQFGDANGIVSTHRPDDAGSEERAYLLRKPRMAKLMQHIERVAGVGRIKSGGQEDCMFAPQVIAS